MYMCILPSSLSYLQNLLIIPKNGWQGRPMAPACVTHIAEHRYVNETRSGRAFSWCHCLRNQNQSLLRGVNVIHTDHGSLYAASSCGVLTCIICSAWQNSVANITECTLLGKFHVNVNLGWNFRTTHHFRILDPNDAVICPYFAVHKISSPVW